MALPYKLPVLVGIGVMVKVAGEFLLGWVLTLGGRLGACWYHICTVASNTGFVPACEIGT